LRCSRRTPKCTTTSSLYVARREYMHAFVDLCFQCAGETNFFS
jgi:hypothetical protein